MVFARILPDAEPRACPHCGVEFVPPRKKPAQVFCGHSCSAKSHNAARRLPMMLLGAEKRAEKIRGTGKGPYVKRGGRHEHRTVAETKIGRALEPGEIVHHDDEDGHNNAPDNLLVTNRPDHGRHHNLGKKRTIMTVCKFGHPLTGSNVVLTSIGRRRCLICRRKYDRDWQKQRRQSQRMMT